MVAIETALKLDELSCNKQQIDFENCPVCGDRVSGYHYGLLTCESCKVWSPVRFSYIAYYKLKTLFIRSNSFQFFSPCFWI
ncbi:unnamed protein product [Toxocara canis]|uniref:Nuclear receptor domain-containing protein n=1 Tax=Toxocara canis TaxID=6265 RepID=A0A183V9F6_TOXCA|nr:unnamed protein product [Toxocara canis]